MTKPIFPNRFLFYFNQLNWSNNLCKWLTISILLIFFIPILRGQKSEDLGRAEPFLVGLKGTIYKYTLPKLQRDFDFKKVNYYMLKDRLTPIGTVYAQSLNISERDLKSSFPGLPDSVRYFAIIYTGVFESDSAEYFFGLKSDDGSRLWIDSTEVINCDGIHQFHEPCGGRIRLNKGFHNIKVWYFQGMVDRMGLVLLMKKRDDKTFKPFDLKPYETDLRKLLGDVQNSSSFQAQVDNKVLFETGKTDLKSESSEWLLSMTRLLMFNTTAKVRIEGHTDDVGSTKSNLLLSQQRAQAVADALRNMGVPNTISLEAIGVGEEKPIAPNTTEEGRAKNRRVEVFVEKQGKN